MSSMAMEAIEMGIDPCIGPDFQPWDGPGKCFYEDCDDTKEPEWFATAQEAQSYAKENIGTIITRSPDGNGYRSVANMEKGEVNDPYRISEYGFGYFGEPDESHFLCEEAYEIWKIVLGVVYRSQLRDEKPSYIGYTVCEEWHCFAVFFEWFKLHYICNYELMIGFLTEGTKHYSPSTCLFMPPSVISSLSGIKTTITSTDYITYYKATGRWLVLIPLLIGTVGNRDTNKYLGYYETEGLAREARDAYINSDEHQQFLNDRVDYCESELGSNQIMVVYMALQRYRSVKIQGCVR